MDVKSDKVQEIPLNTLPRPVVESVNLNTRVDDSNDINILTKKPHHEILKWLENKNLGKL